MAGNAVEFIRSLKLDDVPAEAIYHAKRCLLDLIGVAAAGSTTPLSRIVRDHVAEQFGASRSGSLLFFDDRRVSAVGAALANGMTIDAFDAHDGHPATKGHAGCGVLSALLSFSEPELTGSQFLADLITGYEIAIRAGLALHSSVADYHTSGAWVALGAAAVGSRRLGLAEGLIREALGIAEYHGPRSQMMRCIDHPTMVKDGSGWGAMGGVSAALLARDGFTGAPAITVEGGGVENIWNDLGTRWTITEQYLKPFPVCRWAQPPIEAVRQLQSEQPFSVDEIIDIEVRTFHEAVRLATPEPRNTEQAQYSLPFPLASYLVRGSVGPSDISGDALSDPDILRLSRSVRLVEDAGYCSKFPAERWADVKIWLKDGRALYSDPVQAHGNAENPLSDTEISAKFNELMVQSGAEQLAGEIERTVSEIQDSATIEHLLKLLGSAPERQAARKKSSAVPAS